MERRTRQAVSALAITATLAAFQSVSAKAHAAAEETPFKMRVRLDDKAGVQGALLKLAEARAAEVFAMSGVQIEWIDGKEAARLKLVVPYMVLIMAEAPPSLRVGRGTQVMGQSVPIANRAYVYYDRLPATITPPRDIVTTLGDVIAHELGHLTLPPGHSSTGIMRSNINMTSRRVDTFTEREAAQIHELLQDRARTLKTN